MGSHAPYYAPAMEKTPLALRLGEFVAALSLEDLPPSVVDKAKALVNHAVTVGLAGAPAERSQAARGPPPAHQRPRGRRPGPGPGAPPPGAGSRLARPPRR